MKIILTFLFLCFAVPAWGVTYYVAQTGGSDSNNCTTAQTHTTGKLTFLAGLACANSVGDTLIVKAGTYDEAVPSSTVWPTGTSWANAGRVVAYQVGGPGTAYDEVTLNNPGAGRVLYFSGSSRQYIIIEGFILDGTGGDSVNSGDTVKIDAGAHHIRLMNSEVKNAVRQGILVSASTPAGGPYSRGNQFINLNVHNNGAPGDPKSHGFYIEAGENIIERCDIHDNEGFGVHLYEGNTKTKAYNNIVRFNKSYSNGKGGILLSSGANNIAHNNLLYSNVESGIQIGYEATGSKVYNNTFYGNASGIEIRNSTKAGTDIKNNIFRSTGTNVLWFTGTPPLTTADITDTTNFKTGDPLFVNPGIDFGLQADSTAINAGTAITDHSANGLPDQGAHETFTCTGADSTKVPDTASDNTMVITCENNRSSPLLPAATCAEFSARKNTVDNPITGCSRTSDNQITLTLQNAYVNGDSADWTYSTTTGNVSDSAKIGNTANQRLNAVITPQGAINEVGSGAAPTLEQVACRFGSYGGTEAAPDYIKATGVNVTIPPGACGHVRCQVSNTGTSFGQSGFSLRAQRNGAGGYAVIPDGPCTSTGICFPFGTGNTPPELVAGYTTERLAGSGTFVAGGILLRSAEVPNVTLATGQDTEFLVPYCVGSGNTESVDYFDLRIYRAGGTALTTYTQTPRIVIGGYTAQTGAR